MNLPIIADPSHKPKTSRDGNGNDAPQASRGMQIRRVRMALQSVSLPFVVHNLSNDELKFTVEIGGQTEELSLTDLAINPLTSGYFSAGNLIELIPRLIALKWGVFEAAVSYYKIGVQLTVVSSTTRFMLIFATTDLTTTVADVNDLTTSYVLGPIKIRFCPQATALGAPTTGTLAARLGFTTDWYDSAAGARQQAPEESTIAYSTALTPLTTVLVHCRSVSSFDLPPDPRDKSESTDILASIPATVAPGYTLVYDATSPQFICLAGKLDTVRFRITDQNGTDLPLQTATDDIVLGVLIELSD